MNTQTLNYRGQDNPKPDQSAPEVIRCRSGLLAKLSDGPHYSPPNDTWLVLYDLGDYRFSLCWSSMTYYSDGREHPLDCVAELLDWPPASPQPVAVAHALPVSTPERRIDEATASGHAGRHRAQETRTMHEYSYVALDDAGKCITVTVEADDEQGAHEALAEIVARDFPNTDIDAWHDA